MSSPRETEPADAGFTLMEALAALTVLAASLGALAELTHQTARKVHFAERRIELVATARKALAAAPADGAIAEGVTQGELNGERWTMTVSPYPTESASLWEPMLVRIEVRNGEGERVEVDTVRLRRRGAS